MSCRFISQSTSDSFCISWLVHFLVISKKLSHEWTKCRGAMCAHIAQRICRLAALWWIVDKLDHDLLLYFKPIKWLSSIGISIGIAFAQLVFILFMIVMQLWLVASWGLIQPLVGEILLVENSCKYAFCKCHTNTLGQILKGPFKRHVTQKIDIWTPPPHVTFCHLWS